MKPLTTILPRGVRGRVVLLLVCAMLPGFAVALYGAADARRRDRGDVQQNAYRLALATSVAHERLFDTARELLLVMTRVPSIVDARDERCAQELRAVLVASPQFLTLGRAFEDGRVGCRARNDARSDVSSARWFQRALRAAAPVTSRFEAGVAGPRGGLVVALGFRSTRRGVLFAALDAGSLSVSPTFAALPAGTSVNLIDGDGVLVARNPDPERWVGRDVRDQPVVRAALARHDGFLESPGLEGLPRLFAFHRLTSAGDADLVVTVGIPRDAAFAAANRRAAANLAFLSATAALSLSVAWFGSGRLILAPLNRLRAAVGRASAGDFDPTPAPTPAGGREIHELSGAFDVLARNLQARDAEARAAVEALRALAQRSETVREQERTAIAREIHDQLGQNLTALRMDVEWLARALRDGSGSDPTVGRKLQSMASLLDQTVPLVRNISRRLRPGVLDALGLRAALEWQLEEFAGRTGTRTDLVCDLDDSRLDSDAATVLFRIFQETLTNVSRHARAASVTVHLGQDGAGALLEVSDDGTGMPEHAAADPHALGLLGMRERAQAVGGRLSIHSRPGRGTTVSAWVPLEVSEQHGTA